MDTKDFLKNERLRYVSDEKPGITRKRKGTKTFWYFDRDGKRIKDKETLERIKALVIPPAWKEVWISPYKNGYLQATGLDAKGRKQYLYHEEWNKIRDKNKFDKLIEFATVLPKIRSKVARDLGEPGMPREKVLAAVVWLMERTLIRVGNEEYVEENNSFGLTTLENKHTQVKGADIYFNFKGKSGVPHKVHIQSKKIAKIVRRCKELPGQELFEYMDDEGNIKDVASQDVNNYLKEATGMEVTAKDFRTWGGTLKAAEVLDKIGIEKEKTAIKKNEAEAVKEVSQYLRNKPATCRKYYIHPVILKEYAKGLTISDIDKKSLKAKKVPKGLGTREQCVFCMLSLH